MQLNIGGVTFYRYYYVVKNVEMSINGQSYFFQDGTCKYLYIRHDYLGRRFPIIQMGLEMDSDMIQEFYTYKDTAILKLDIAEQQLDEEDNVMNTTLYLRGSFNCIPARDKTTYVTTPDSESEEMVDIMRRLQLFEMYLIDMNMVNSFSKEISLVLEQASKSAMLQMMFTQRDIQTGIVMATPPMYDDELEYPSVSLGDLIANITEINERYGLYDARPIIYYDYKYLYCINPYDPDIMMESATEFGNVTFTIFNSSRAERNIVGSCTDLQTQTHYVNLRVYPKVQEVSEKDTNTKFSTVLSVDSTGGISKNTVDENATKMHFTRQMNSLTQQQLIHEKLHGHRVNLTITNCCVSTLRPYKIYTFDVDTEYSDKGLTGHDYRLIGMDIFLERDEYTRYIQTVEVRLQRPTRDENA